MQAAAPSKLISCILPPGIAYDVLEALKSEKEITEANVNNARGMGHLTPLAHRRRIGSETEKEILTVIVPAERADELFAFIFERAEIGRPHGGIIFMNDLVRATPFVLPDLPEE
ncbi:MAG: P-II family nitrogen regulator [Thermoanaerobaculia bacterium]|nr:P-II family nitrogen regulator [Thermoanaerobaculia bacterium]